MKKFFIKTRLTPLIMAFASGVGFYSSITSDNINILMILLESMVFFSSIVMSYYMDKESTVKL